MSGSANGHPQDRLSEYLDDELTIEERAAIDRHLASCEDCRSHLDGLRRLARAIAEAGVPPVPADLHEKIGRRLDEATVLRPRRWRFALPATIAATISAIGILIAVQMREGRLPPSVPESPHPSEVDLGKVRSDAPLPAPPPAPAAAPPSRDERVAETRKAKTDSDALGTRDRPESDLERAPQPKDLRAVMGGVASGGDAAVEEGIGGAHENRVSAAREAAGQMAAVDQASRLATAPAPASAAKAETVSICVDRWSDSGVRGAWEVADPIASARELNTMAHDAGGIGLWRGIADGRPYLLIVPRSRYEEIFYALRARGIAGLVDPPVLAPGDDCTALSITIALAR